MCLKKTNSSMSTTSNMKQNAICLGFIRKGEIKTRFKWLARLGLNQRPPPCQGGALPLSYEPKSENAQNVLDYYLFFQKISNAVCMIKFPKPRNSSSFLVFNK